MLIGDYQSIYALFSLLKLYEFIGEATFADKSTIKLIKLPKFSERNIKSLEDFMFKKIPPLVNKRINAFTIDLFLIFVLKEITVNSFVKSLDLIFFRFPFKVQYFLSTEFTVFTSITLLSIFFCYFTLFTFVTNGRTPGKYVMGLRVYTKSQEISLVQSMTRTFLNLFSVFTFCLPFLAVIMKKNHIGLSDYLAKTTVDFEKRPYIVDHVDSWQLSFFDLTSATDTSETSNVISLKNDKLKSAKDEVEENVKDAA